MQILILIFLLVCPLTANARCHAKFDEAFPRFFQKFGADKKFAISRTLYPYASLVHEYGVDENGNDDPGVSKTWITRDEDKSAPTLDTFRQENGLTVTRTQVSATKASVVVEKLNTDWVVSYHFTRRGKCWYFKHAEDHSL